MFPFIRILFTGLILFTLSCGGPKEPTPAEKKKISEPPTVAVSKVIRTDLGSDFTVTAEFRPYQEADLYAKVSGYLSKLNVDLGDSVRSGQLLAVLEVPELNQELEHATQTEKRIQLETGRAKGDVERAQSVLNLRQVTFERIQSIAEKRPNLIARQELDDAQARFEESRGQLAAAQANLAAAEQQIQVSLASRARIQSMLEYLRITAPFSGVVTARYVFPGSLIQSGTSSATQAKPVVRISQINRLRLVTAVPESLISRLKTGQPLEIKVDTLKRVFQGKVSRFSDSVSSVTRTMEMEIDLPNPDLILKPGMVAHVAIPVERRQRVLVIPTAAVVEREGKPVVYKITENQTISITPVQRGFETNELVEILSGLNEGDLAVTTGHTQLKADQKVQTKTVEAR